MIDKTMSLLLTELNGFLAAVFPASEPHAVLARLALPDGSAPQGIDNKIVITITNVEREAAARSMESAARAESGMTLRITAPLNLNVYFLVSASFSDNYLESLRLLSSSLGFFQAKPVFTPQNSANFPPGLQRLTVEMVNLPIQDLQNLWATTGAKYLPSAYYKARMVTMPDAWVVERVPVITSTETGVDRT